MRWSKMRVTTRVFGLAFMSVLVLLVGKGVWNVARYDHGGADEPTSAQVDAIEAARRQAREVQEEAVDAYLRPLPPGAKRAEGQPGKAINQESGWSIDVDKVVSSAGECQAVFRTANWGITPKEVAGFKVGGRIVTPQRVAGSNDVMTPCAPVGESIAMIRRNREGLETVFILPP